MTEEITIQKSAKEMEILDEIFLEPLDESDLDSSKDVYVMVLENNSIVSVASPTFPKANLAEPIDATRKLDDSVLKRFEEQQMAIKKIEEQQRELKLMYKKL